MPRHAVLSSVRAAAKGIAERVWGKELQAERSDLVQRAWLPEPLLGT